MIKLNFLTLQDILKIDCTIICIIKNIGNEEMKKILLCCGAGMSSSLLASKMDNKAKEKNMNAKVWAVSVGELRATIKEGVNVVLIGPQIRYKLKEVEELCRENGNIPCGLINSVHYGTMNVDMVLDAAYSMMSKE